MLYIMFFVLYCILFEIPIPFLAKKVSDSIYFMNKEELDSKNAKIKIAKVAVAWSYDINRPVILISGILYKDSNFDLTLTKFGIFPSIIRSIKDKRLYIEKISVEGLNFMIIEDQKGSYSIKLHNKDISPLSDSKNNNATTSGNFFSEIAQNEYNKNGDFFQVIKDIQASHPVISFLNEFSISDSNILFINKEKDLIAFDVKNLSVEENKDRFDLNLDSSLFFDNQIDLTTSINLDGYLNSKNILVLNASLTNAVLSNIHTYFLKDKIKDLDINGFNGSVSLNYVYDLKNGLKNFTSEVNVKDGSLYYKDYITKTLDVDSLSYRLWYEIENQSINISNFNILLKNKSVWNSKKLGTNIAVSRISSDFNINLKEKLLTSKNLSVFIDKNKFDLDLAYKPYFERKSGFFNLYVKGSNLKIDFVKRNWPREFLSEVRRWIISSIHKANIDSTYFKMNLILSSKEASIPLLEGEVRMSDINLTYINGMPIVEGEEVVLNYHMDGVDVFYKNATTGSIFSKEGYIRVFDINNGNQSYDAALAINIFVDSDVVDGLKLIDNKPLNLLKNNEIDANLFSGKANGTVKLTYDFNSEEVINKDIKLKLQMAGYKNVFNNLDATDGDLTLNLNDNGIRIGGDISFLAERMKLVAQINWENLENIIQTYSVDVINFPARKLKSLEIFHDLLLEGISKYSDTKINYYKDSNNEKIDFYVDMERSEIFADLFNYTKKEGEPLFAKGTAILKKSKVVSVNNLIIKTPKDLDIGAEISFDKEEVNKISFSNFHILNRADFIGSLDFLGDERYLYLRGKFIDVEPMFNYIKGREHTNYFSNKKEIIEDEKSTVKRKRGFLNRKSHIEETTNKKTNENSILSDLPEEDGLENLDTNDNSLSEKIGNFRLNLYFDKVINKDETLNKVAFIMTWKDTMLRALNFSSSLDIKNNNSYILFNEESSMLVVEVNNLGRLLRLLDFDSDIKGGNLEAKVKISKVVSPLDNKKFFLETGGDFVLNDFSAGFSFASAYGSFRGKDLYFRIDELELRGNLMGGKMKGFIDLRNSKVDIYGKLIPIWSANNLISNAPLIKELLKNTTKDRSLIQFNARIYGNLDDTRYSIFTKDIEKGDIINELNYEELGDDIIYGKQKNATIEEDEFHGNLLDN